jgi:two-component system LytT family response regulator
MFYIALYDPHDNTRESMADLFLSQETLPETIRICVYKNFKDLRSAFQHKKHFNLVFLQDLKAKEPSLGLARQVRSMDSTVPIVMVSPFESLSLDGYDVPLFRFYTAPLDAAQVRQLLQELMSQPTSFNGHYFVFCNASGIYQLKLSDICYFESYRNQLHLHTADHCYIFHNSISRLETRLRRFRFHRVHKSFLVNLNYIRCVHGDTIDLDNGASVPLSKHKASSVRRYLMDLMQDYL